MSLGTETLLAGGAIGLGLAGFGATILITGRAPAATTRAFRDLRDAGRYHLLFGLALALLAIGTRLPGAVPGIASAVIAVILVAVALIRHRPRPKPDREPADEAEPTVRRSVR